MTPSKTTHSRICALREEPQKGSKMRDGDVREVVRARLLKKYGADENSRIVEEMGIWSGAVRIDLAVINGHLFGVEIKSDSDTLERLPYQAEIYSKVFDRITLVVGEKHAEKALSIVPDWWRCEVATMRNGRVRVRPFRRGRANPSIDSFVLAELLWKEEAIYALEQHGLARGWRAKTASDIRARLIENVPLKKLKKHVLVALKARTRLGQLVPSQFNVPVDTERDPTRHI